MNHKAVIFLDGTSQATSYGSVNSKKNEKFLSGTFSWMSQFDFPGIWIISGIQQHLASLWQQGMLCLQHDMQQVTVASVQELANK